MIKIDCQECSGAGWISYGIAGDKTCDRCKGLGYIELPEPLGLTPVAGRYCPNCLAQMVAGKSWLKHACVCPACGEYHHPIHLVAGNPSLCHNI